MASSIYPVPITVNTGTISANTKILANDVTFAAGEFRPGGGAIIRVYFCFKTTVMDANYSAAVTQNGSTTPLLKLNGENSFILNDSGYYRFDIGVEEDTQFNLSISEDLIAATEILELRIHKIVFGA